MDRIFIYFLFNRITVLLLETRSIKNTSYYGSMVVLPVSRGEGTQRKADPPFLDEALGCN